MKFAKYLPVEGEIKEGELYQDMDGNIWEHKRDLCFTPVGQKVKLFLCSRDIQVGEIFNEGNHTYNAICTSRDGRGIYSEGKWEEDYHDPADCYKVIGEISPEATWVKEGDEFYEEGIDFTPAVRDEDYDKPANEREIFYMILCPTCKSFH